jgi:hypothetical protein
VGVLFGLTDQRSDRSSEIDDPLGFDKTPSQMGRVRNPVLDFRIRAQLAIALIAQELFDFFDKAAAASLAPGFRSYPNSFKERHRPGCAAIGVVANCHLANPTCEPSGASAMKPHEFSLPRIPSISSAWTWTEIESGQRDARMSAQADRSEARIVLTVNSMAEPIPR